MSRYRALLSVPGARVLLGTSVLARLGLGITSLALVLLVAEATGHYAPAALAVALYALANAAASPVAGRLADRFGPSPVLRVLGVAHPLALVGLLLAARHGTVGLIWVASIVAGATFPPITASVRGAWNALTAPDTGRHDLHNTAMAAEASLVEVIFTAGPALVAAFVAVGSPGTAILASAGFTFVGTPFVAGSAVMRARVPHPAHTGTRGLGPLRVPGFGPLLACVSGLGLAFGVAGVAVPAYASSHVEHRPASAAGVLLAVWGVGSTIGGIWFGTRHPSMAPHRLLAWLTAGVAASYAVLPLMPGVTWLGVALFVGGATIAPALSVQNAITGRITPVTMHTEAYTWVITTAVSASAAGAAVTGVLVDHGGLAWSFLLAAATVSLGALVAAWPSGPLARADAAASPSVVDTVPATPPVAQ
jgi:MFS family permease